MAKKRAKKAMKQDHFYTATGVLLSFSGILHLFRLIYGWNIEIEGWDVPKFISILLVVATLYLALQAFKHDR